VAEPRFIEAHRLGQFTVRATDVDVVTDLMIHDIDLVLMMVKSPVVRISASGTSVITNKIDIANARLEFENGAVANLTSSRVSEKQFRRMRVFAEDKYVAANLNSQSVEVLMKEDVEGELFPTIKKEVIDIKPVQPLDEEIKNFISTIRDKGQPKITALDGLSALKIAEEICQDIEQRNQSTLSS
jgi:Predicted dehydrogenases and related proteins